MKNKVATKSVTSKKALQKKTVALLGQPNSGKSTFFNALTGSKQHVGNWPGKTVTQKIGHYLHHTVDYELVDLPGTYGLSANSEEEIITRNFIESQKADLVFVFVDASQLRRSLFILADYIGINAPTVLILNMIDIAEKQNKKIDIEGLQKELKIPVIPLVASNKKSYGKLHKFIESFEEQTSQDKTQNSSRKKLNLILDSKKIDSLYTKKLGEKYSAIKEILSKSAASKGKAAATSATKSSASKSPSAKSSALAASPYSTSWLAIKLIENDTTTHKFIKKHLSTTNYKRIEKIVSGIDNSILVTGDVKFSLVNSLVEKYIEEPTKTAKLSSFDKVALHPKWGKFIAGGIILTALCFSIFIGEPIMEVISNVFGQLTSFVREQLVNIAAPRFLTSLLCDGVISAISYSFQMISYIFGISLVFAIIENVGYMARISYVFDHMMSKIGLQGKSIMPFILCFGCTVGGATGSRVLDSVKQRIMTIALSWVIPCGCTWGVVGFVSSTFFGSKAVFVVILLFAVAVLHAFITYKIFSRKLTKTEENYGIIMELPPYHTPQWKVIFTFVFTEILHTIRKAFVLILCVSIIFWLLSYTQDGNIANSILFKIGSTIEPFTMIFGLTWEFFIAFVISIVGKEAALGVIASIFSAQTFLSGMVQTDVVDNISSVSANMLHAASQPQALAFLFVFFFNVPCMMAFISTIHETHSLKWTVKIGAYYIGFALLLGALAFHVSSLFL